ncbi:MAG: carboxypeptidase regulatory-like domain-containing protein, partial [Candidatus Methanomethylophilaceae archaeon]|nr:carboxypeptidase regulatory-like domain-containing protein [Candidatus Methanomethylophilaceae archaeon]
KAYIGPSASEAGESSSYGYLYDLSSSTGSVAASPEGMAGFKISKWIVRYNPDENVTDNEGWEYMDHSEAVAKQKADGGIINYLSSYILYEYTGIGGSGSVSGTVVSSYGSVEGIRAELYSFTDSGKTVLTSTDTVREIRTSDVTKWYGEYTLVTSSSEYEVLLKSGDVVIASFRNSVPETYDAGFISVDGTVSVDGNLFSGKPMKLVFQNKSVPAAKYEVTSYDGTFSLPRVLEGGYDVTMYDSSAAKAATADVTIVSDGSSGISGLVVKPTSQKITVTVNDSSGNSAEGGRITAVNTSNGLMFSAPVEDGRAVISVLPGTYTLQASEGYVSSSSTTYNVSSSARSATLTVYNADEVSISDSRDLVFSAGSFSTVTYDGGSKVSLPKGLATDERLYTVYGMDGNKVILGTYDGTLSLGEYAAVKVKGTLKNGNDGASGNVYFVNDSKQTVYVKAEEDGSFEAVLPAGTYLFFADNGSDKVAVTSYTVSSDTDLGDISLVDGRRITATLRYASGTSSGNVGLPFVTSDLSYTYSGTEYHMYGMTGTSGSSVFFIPDDVASKVVFNGGSLDNATFYGSSMSSSASAGTSNTTIYVTVALYSESSPGANYVKQIPVTSGYDMTLTPYVSGDDIVFTAGETKNMNIGQYSVKMSGNKYFNGTVYLYPGDSSLRGLEPMDAHKITITKEDSDKLTIETIDEDAEYAEDGSDYYFKDGYVYYLSSVAGASAGSNVRFATVDLTSDYYITSIDMTANQAPMTVTGYIGVAASGDLIVSDGSVKIYSPISNGQYTVVMPASMAAADFNVSASHTANGKEYTYTGSALATGLNDGSVFNVAVTGDGTESEDEDADFTAEITSAVFANGNGEATVKITNNTDSPSIYVVKSGSAWALAKTVSVTVDPKASGTVTVSGYYNENKVAPGSDGLSLIVSDIAGTDSKTLNITENSAAPAGSKGADILKPGERSGEHEAAIDKVSATEYMYAVTVVNHDNYSKAVRISAPEHEGWYVTVSDESGYTIRGSDAEFTIYGLQTAVYYVKYMLVGDGTGITVPSVPVSVECGSVQKTLSLSPADIEVEVNSMSASGDNIYNTRSDIPAGIWFLLAVGALLLIAAFWLGSKRGVFTRR